MKGCSPDPAGTADQDREAARGGEGRAPHEKRRGQLVCGVLLALFIVPQVAIDQTQETIDPDRWTGCWDVEWG